MLKVKRHKKGMRKKTHDIIVAESVCIETCFITKHSPLTVLTCRFYRNVRSRKLQQRGFRANLTPTSASTRASWCSAPRSTTGVLNTNSHRFCVYVNNLRFQPTDARLRGDNFNNRKINCFRSNGAYRCESCYKFSGQEVSQLNRGELRVMVENTNNNLCRISGNLRQW